MKVPSDCSRNSCGYCEWFSSLKKDGYGKCAIFGEERYYKCFVCSEFELNYEISE